MNHQLYSLLRRMIYHLFLIFASEVGAHVAAAARAVGAPMPARWVPRVELGVQESCSRDASRDTIPPPIHLRL